MAVLRTDVGVYPESPSWCTADAPEQCALAILSLAEPGRRNPEFLHDRNVAALQAKKGRLHRLGCYPSQMSGGVATDSNIRCFQR